LTSNGWRSRRPILGDGGLVFDAFDLRVAYDKIDGRVQISATITEAVADLLQEPGGLALCGTKLRGWDSNPQPLG
jgi:hypothetical protein